MLLDCHLHLENRTDDENAEHFQNPKMYIQAGKERGVEIFGFSDHAYIFSEARKINFNNWQKERCKYEINEYLDLTKKIETRIKIF